jgi:hypothetical protein
MTRPRHVPLFFAIALACAAYPAEAQEACKMETLKDPKLTLADMFARAEARAKAWKPDVVVAKLGNTNLGPLDEQGRSEAWNFMFFSPSANANVTINTFRGMFTCYAMDGAAGRLPDLKPGFVVDGAKLYGLAKQHGGSLLAQGYTVAIQTAAAPGNRHATWYITFEKDNKAGAVTIIVDANSGAVEQVLK